MFKYMLKGIFMMLPVILSITFLVFLILSISPGNPALLNLVGQATAAEIAEKQVEK